MNHRCCYTSDILRVLCHQHHQQPPIFTAVRHSCHILGIVVVFLSAIVVCPLTPLLNRRVLICFAAQSCGGAPPRQILSPIETLSRFACSCQLMLHVLASGHPSCCLSFHGKHLLTLHSRLLGFSGIDAEGPLKPCRLKPVIATHARCPSSPFGRASSPAMDGRSLSHC